jgi:glycerol-3-phosphate acyltransferase PlsY
MDVFLPFLLPLLGYLSGSLPFAVWVTRLATGADVRDAGSGHAGATNTIRQAGFGWGALVLALDIAKGFLPVWLAFSVGRDTISPYVAALVVAGHCWPIFAQFRGGMGLATAGGALLALDPRAFLLALGLLVLLTLALRHSARAGVFTGLLTAPILWLLDLRGPVFWAALGVGLVVAFRFLMDWNRKYRELWLDREQQPKKDETP